MDTFIISYREKRLTVTPDKPVLTIGRSLGNHIVVFDHCVSRQHLSVEYQQGRLCLVDQSQNGTYIYEDQEEIYLHRQVYVVEKDVKVILGRRAQTPEDREFISITKSPAYSPEHSSEETLIYTINLNPFLDYLSRELNHFLVVLDSQLHIEYCNKVWEAITGESLGRQRGKDFGQWLGVEQREEIIGEMLKVLIQGTYVNRDIPLQLKGEVMGSVQLLSKKFLQMSEQGLIVWGTLAKGMGMKLGYLYGRYEICQLLSTSDFGQTYLGYDHGRPQPVRCVIKQLDLGNIEAKYREVARRLFYGEALTLEELGHHPAIPRLLAYFDKDSYFYLVQEYVEGNNLQRVWLQERWTPEQVVEFLLALLEILHYIHSHGVIHRDIKPSNIMRRPNGTYVLIDFGSIKRIPQELMKQRGFVYSQPSVPVGTPGYVAPEQEAGYPVPASDLYSLGVVAIEALTRRSFAEIRHQWHQSVPPALKDFLDSMVAVDPQKRYPNAEVARRALSELWNKRFPT